MGSSGKSRSVDLVGRVAAGLLPRLPAGAKVVLALSGGLDSVVLLDCAVRISQRGEFDLRALHVHHGLSPNADGWAAFCRELCAVQGIPIEVVRVDLRARRGLGIESAARDARYRALARCGADAVLTAHHRNDQAETVLLQLLRGSGPTGLAAMPVARMLEDSGGPLLLLRPLLDVDRSEIEAHARERGLRWVDDESNDDVSFARNYLRHRVIPVLEQGWPGAVHRLAGAARMQSEAAELLGELARLDAGRAAVPGGLGVEELRRLGPTRGINVLYWLLREAGAPVPRRAALSEFWRQLTSGSGRVAPMLCAGNRSLRVYRGALRMEREAELEREREAVLRWSGEPRLALPQFGGMLRFDTGHGRGVCVARLRDVNLTVRSRRGGERMKIAAGGPTRTLKNLFQERGVPPWQRRQLPLVYCGDKLVAVPGVGEDCRWRAGQAEPGVSLSWEPAC